MRKKKRRSHAAELTMIAFPAKSTITLFLLLMLLTVSFTPRIHAQGSGSDDAKESAHALKLWGTPGEVRLIATDPGVKVSVSVNVIAENTGKENLLLLRRAPLSSAEEIVSVANPQAPVWRQEHQAAALANNDPSLPKLRHTLDQQDPPEDEVITLGPGDSIGWNVVVQLDVPKGNGPAQWDGIRKACPCALRLDLDLWPLESAGDKADPNFGRKVSKKWRKKGALVFTAKQTDPIEIKLPEK